MTDFGERLRRELQARPDLALGRVLLVIASEQRLCLLEGGTPKADYPVSTSRFGLGCRNGSHKTPLGWHEIAECIGAGEACGEVFIGRSPQGRIAHISCSDAPSEKDVITSRILWLSGLEPGTNLGGDVDSHDRYIYIHGTADEGLLGQPASIGCVRMGNADVIQLFERVKRGDRVLIAADWAADGVEDP